MLTTRFAAHEWSAKIVEPLLAPSVSPETLCQLQQSPCLGWSYGHATRGSEGMDRPSHCGLVAGKRLGQGALGGPETSSLGPHAVYDCGRQTVPWSSYRKLGGPRD